ncbi:MAG: MASE1 domain-containing protein [bacterium]
MFSIGGREKIYKTGFFLSAFTLIAVAYITLGLLGLLSQNSQDVSAFWPAKGFGLGIFILLPKKYWYAILIGIGSVFLIDSNLSFPLVLILTLSQFMAFLLTFYYQSKNMPSLQRFNDSADFLRVVFVMGIILSVLSALFGVGLLALNHIITQNFVLNTISWAVGDWVGISIITPLMLIFRGLFKQSFRNLLSVEVMFFSIVGICINAFAFQLLPGMQDIQYPLIFVPAVFSIWMGVRFGVQGAVLSNLVLAVSAFASSVLSVGPYAAGHDVYVYLWLGLFILVSSITSLYIAFTQQGIYRKNKNLKRAEHQLSRAMKASDIGAWEWKIKEKCVHFDQTWLSKFGLPIERQWLTNQEIKILIFPDDYPGYVKDLKAYLEGEVDIFQSTYRANIPNSETIWVEATGKITRWDDEGDPVIMVGSNQDVTKRKQLDELQQHLLKSERLESLGLMAGGVAHDFNNLLQGIIGHASLAMERADTDEMLKDNLDVILQSSDSAAMLCRNLLAFSGGADFSNSEVNLNYVIRQMNELIDVSIAKKAVICYHLAENLPTFNADSGQVRQLFINLINNAAEACEQRDGKVIVETGVISLVQSKDTSMNIIEPIQAGNYIFLSVSDNGVGISEEIRDQIFDPFFTTKSIGRGLGMAAVSGIVKAHKAGLELISHPDKGTMIKIYFPCSS